MTGWPWPLDAVQGWFESLWQHVSDAAVNAVSAVRGWLSDTAQWILDNLHTPIQNWFFKIIYTILPHIKEGYDQLWSITHDLPEPWVWIARFFLLPAAAAYTFLKPVITWVWDQTSPLLGPVKTWVDNAAAWVTSNFTAFCQDPVGYITGSVTWLWNQIKPVLGPVGDWVESTASWITDNFTAFCQDPAGYISNGASWVAGEVKTMFDGAVNTLGGFLSDAMAGVAGALGSGLQAFAGWLNEGMATLVPAATTFLNEAVVTPIAAALQWIYDRISDVISGIYHSLESLIHGHSAILPEAAAAMAEKVVVTYTVGGSAAEGTIDAATTKVVGTGLNLDGLKHYLRELFNPSMVTGATLGVLIGVGVRSPLTQYYRRMFRPEIPAIRDAQTMLWRGKITMDQFKDVIARWGYGEPFESGYVELTKRIPPAPDLITMVVREAFVPEMVIEAPKIFAEYLTKSGYSKEWADRYWTAHFVPISLRQAYANLWRGYWDKKKFFRALTIADIHPMWHEDIYNVAFTPPGVRELGYGYDTGLYTVEDIKKYRMWGGLSPEDAEKAARAMVAYRTETEREALRREALYDFTAGLDDEETLRSKLRSIGGRPEVIDLWVARAKYRYERDLKKDLIKMVKDQAVKGLISLDQLREDLSTIGVIPERIEVHVSEVETRRARVKREQESEKKRKLTEAKLAKAWELGLIGDEQYVSALVERDYTESDARLMLEILRTPRPITPEEIERRKASITARINRAKRRYELMISRLDSQIGLISDEITASEATQKEVLDVYDTQISWLTEELATAPPEKVPAIEKRLALIRERRDVAVARHAEHLTKLKGALAAAADRKQELLKLRDEEIGELESELERLGVAG